MKLRNKKIDYYIPEYDDETKQDLDLLFGGDNE